MSKEVVIENTIKTIKLNSCPICHSDDISLAGGTVHGYTGTFIRCNNCGFRVRSKYVKDGLILTKTKIEASKIWNKCGEKRNPDKYGEMYKHGYYDGYLDAMRDFK